jgi:murein tripeptide amidase MpaA
MLLLAASPAVAAEEHIQPYTTSVSLDEAQFIADEVGVELDHVGYDGKSATQHLNLELFPSQAPDLESKGIDLAAQTLPKLAPKAARATGGDSPNPFYDVFRSYSEAGGIADELRALARDNPALVKLVEIGKSLLGKPILTIKITDNARNTPDGTRPSVLYGATNHAREWITPEVVRREAHWILDNRDDPRVQQILKKTELWFLPVQNPDGYDYTFTCGQGTTVTQCGPGAAGNNRLWRKTLPTGRLMTTPWPAR